MKDVDILVLYKNRLYKLYALYDFYISGLCFWVYFKYYQKIGFKIVTPQ